MCIIAFKPIGRELPSLYLLENCFDNNPDGAGIMYQRNGKVHITKGFMTWPDFERALFKIEKEIDVLKSHMAFHFRIATQGTVIPENCHPFPLSDNILDLQQTRIKADVGIVHNGIISFCKEYGEKSLVSDTQLFIKNYLSPIYKTYPRFYYNRAERVLIEKGTFSKFVIMDGKNAFLLGDFNTYEGIYYSNYTYSYAANKKYSYSKNGLDWWEDECHNYNRFEHQGNFTKTLKGLIDQKDGSGD